MADYTQISAIIESSVKERMEKYVRMSGVKKGHLIEQALLHHLQALDELPQDQIVPARVVLTAQSANLVLSAIEKPAPPTDAMKQLFDDR